MSWLEKLLPSKIQHTDPADRRSIPEGLWVKCPSCETVLYKKDLEEILSHPWFESMNLQKVMSKEYVPSFKPKLSSNPLDV